ncbi:catalase family protein [Pedobacter hartonius]|uniref:Catalase n=1 Tax=Pedobacter hartonius TaxID=425514 RepID=A0A1H4GXG1_9SPHI|nr:catalase family protein [Pedobacter hartonius]SEB14319.1 hypothetical protein SAMN05443550_11213 [Pedobacter hartonius]
MTHKYIKFDPGIENIPPDFNQKVEKIIAETLETVRLSKQRSGNGYATRDVHVKGYGLLKAELEIRKDLPEEFAQGLYAKAGKYKAVIRFSNASSALTTDAKSAPFMGMAIKIFDVAGETDLDDEAHSGTFDYNLISIPSLFCSSIEHYSYINHLVLKVDEYFAKGIPGILKFGYHWLTGMGKFFPTPLTIRELYNFISLSRLKPTNLLLNEYYSVGAVRHGDYIAKIRAKPVTAYADEITRRVLNLKSADQVFRPALAEELKEHNYEFVIQVQLCKDLKRMPVEDLTIKWPEQLSPFVTVANLKIPKQDISGGDNLKIMEHLSFSPFRCLEENRPLGNLQLTRKEVYRQSSILRNKLNHVPRKEPSGPEEIFGLVATAAKQ